MSITWAVIVVWLICGVIAVLIGQKKNINPFGLFALGALLGVIGIVIVLFLPAELPKAPPGMLAVRCPRCTTVQNVRMGLGETFDCWQCKAVEPVAESYR